MDKLFGKKIDTLATFPASEGFFGYQDNFTDDKTDLLLLLNNDIFYEFIKAEDFLKGEYERITLKDVQVNVNYLLIISTSAGLWGYNIGDTVTTLSDSVKSLEKTLIDNENLVNMQNYLYQANMTIANMVQEMITKYFNQTPTLAEPLNERNNNVSENSETIISEVKNNIFFCQLRK